MVAFPAVAADGVATGVRRVAVLRAADDVRVAAVVWAVAFQSVVVLQSAVILVVVVWIVFAGLVLVVSVVELQVVEVLVVGNLIAEVLVVVVFAAGVSVVVPSVEVLIAAVSAVQYALIYMLSASPGVYIVRISSNVRTSLVHPVAVSVIAPEGCLSASDLLVPHSMQVHIAPGFSSTSPDSHISPASHTRGSVGRPAEKTA